MEDRILLRGREAARLLGVSVPVVYKWMGDGTLPCVRLGRSVRVPRERLLRLIEEKTTQVVGA